MIRKRADSSMFLLGGWLFADLLLGLAMLFLTANTVGTPPPPPTPSATALAAQATATAAAVQTREAQSAEEQATADAQATQDAAAAEATVAAFATLQAQSNADVDQITRDLATAAAQATTDAAAAQATINAQATEAALVESIATENANSGANARATAQAAATQLAEIQVIATQNALSGANDLATAQAEAEAARATAEAQAASRATSDSARATAEAEVANIQATVQAAAATATVISERAGQNDISPTYAEVSFEVDVDGILAGDEDAEAAAIRTIRDTFGVYVDCRVGIASTFGWSSDLGEGLQIADAINGLLVEAQPDLFAEAVLENYAFVDPDRGRVEIRIYFYRGCAAIGGEDEDLNQPEDT